MVSLRLATAAVLALGATSPAVAQPAAVRIAIWSFGFSPQPIQLRAGRPVTLILENRSGSGHDFTAPAFFRQATISAGSAKDGEIELKPHETRSVTLVPARGTYQAHCSHFLHKQLGMSAYIYVQ